jgi:hypothetical protein
MSDTNRAGFAVHQEADDVASRSVVRVAVASVAIGATGVFFAGLIVAATAGALQPDVSGPGGPRPPAPEISGIEQTSIRDTKMGIDMRDAQRRQLEGWGWADRDAGVATIPIERAIDLIVEARR